MKENVIIMGAAGRDFHNFNVYFRTNDRYRVVAFTATQIPSIAHRVYPPVLAGPNYPEGIPIYEEKDLVDLIRRFNVKKVVFSYSDISNQEVMEKAALVNAAGADFMLLGTETMLESSKPVIAVCATRTGAGKSPISRKVSRILRSLGLIVGVIRHPMPYGALERQGVQRFESLEDLSRENCTIEEREEYEPHIENGSIVFAGADYEKVLKRAEMESDVILWDGGNNDFPFIRPDLFLLVADPYRAGHEVTYYPSMVNLLMADAVVITKIETAPEEKIQALEESIERVKPGITVLHARLSFSVEDPDQIRGKRVLVVEDGPTLTHGGMPFGAGYLAAKRYGAREIVAPAPFAVGSLIDVYRTYGHLKDVLPSMGYSQMQIQELEETINSVECDLVISGTPIDLQRVININKPIVRVRYEIEEVGKPTLEEVIRAFMDRIRDLKK